MPRTYHKGRPVAVPKIAKDAWARIRQPWYISRLATAIGISRAAVSKWQHVPEDHVDTVAALLGVAAHDLRPDIRKGLDDLMSPPLQDYLAPPQEK